MKIFSADSKNKLIIAIVTTGLIIVGGIYLSLNYTNKNKNKNEIGQCLAGHQVMVTKVIDGDTIVVEGGYHVRLLGIDSDEKGYPCYDQAKIHLEKLILNKEIRLEKDKTDVDKYGRCLRYIFLDGKNINLQMIEDGLAVARFYNPDVKYQDEIKKAEEDAMNNKIGCKWSAAKTNNVFRNGQAKENGFQWEKLTFAITGLKVIKACSAKDYLGKKMIIEGRIVDSHRTTSNVVFLNFEKLYPNQCFTAVIFGSNQDKFMQKPEDYYLNKTVRIKGEIKQYKNRPEIILDNPDQIEVGT